MRPTICHWDALGKLGSGQDTEIANIWSIRSYISVFPSESQREGNRSPNDAAGMMALLLFIAVKTRVLGRYLCLMKAEGVGIKK